MKPLPAAPLRTLASLLVAVSLFGCTLAASPVPSVSPSHPPQAAFEFGRDTFAFPNLVRAENPARNGSFANYCIVMSRAASQFYRFARFDPAAARLSPDAYRRLAGQVMAIGAWRPPRPVGARIVIPGYPDLHTFSQHERTAITAAFSSNFLSMAHWRTWRVTVHFSPQHQEAVAREVLSELAAGQPSVLMITNYPNADLLNHVVLIYDVRTTSHLVEFLAYDPNDPGSPLTLYFEPAAHQFWVGPLTYAPPGAIRVFRLFTSLLL